MTRIYQNLTDLIGQTPLLQLNKYGAVKWAAKNSDLSKVRAFDKSLFFVSGLIYLWCEPL